MINNRNKFRNKLTATYKFAFNYDVQKFGFKANQFSFPLKLNQIF